MYIGSHVSIKNGYLEAAQKAFTLNANAFQYFPKNPRTLIPKTFNKKDAVACAQYCADNGLLSIGHAPYPLNLAASDEMKPVMLIAILNCLEIVEACGSIGLVVHFGKFAGAGSELLPGYRNIIDTLNKSLQQWEGKALILLENQAGAGSQMGTTFEELTQVRNLSDYPEKIGFCLDTCHAFASGLWTGDNWNEVALNGKKLGFFEHLKAVHLNDSLYPVRSHRDRHANIGQGYIGDEHFRIFLHSPYIKRVPVILETAAGANGTHSDEISHVKHLMTMDEIRSRDDSCLGNDTKCR